jgi:murein L,D-transpeptidase YafK
MGLAPMRPALCLLCATLAAPARAAPPCEGRAAAIVVRAADHRLSLCDAGRPTAELPVALGRAGTGKRAAGDNRTPLGTYPLGAPRPSKEFGTFVPVGYPTPDQRRQGLSGGDIGVHGPKRRFAWAGRLNAGVDWTRGCIAVATDEAIALVVRWVKRHPGALIHIEA